jgi:uncharacterized repeat protein (TIGR04042 family)
MPATHFKIQWPDGSQADCYSPSTVVKDYFAPGDHYLLAEFIERARQALNHASERVRAKYGYACSAAMDQLAQIESHARRYASDPNAEVHVIDLS